MTFTPPYQEIFIETIFNDFFYQCMYSILYNNEELRKVPPTCRRRSRSRSENVEKEI